MPNRCLCFTDLLLDTSFKVPVSKDIYILSPILPSTPRAIYTACPVILLGFEQVRLRSIWHVALHRIQLM